jgi:hypothetical protein
LTSGTGSGLTTSSFLPLDLGVFGVLGFLTLLGLMLVPLPLVLVVALFFLGVLWTAAKPAGRVLSSFQPSLFLIWQ